MKSFKQILSESIFFTSEDHNPINLDEHLVGFAKSIDEETGLEGYVNENLSVPLKHEHLHEWVIAAGYLYETKTFKPKAVTEHAYVKHGINEDHHMLVLTKGDQRDVWQVLHQSTQQRI